MNNEKIALYRQWRPMTFDEIVGQERVVENLKHQVLEGSINHAYLFSGIRGTGKTTTAKVMSRAINCLDPQEGNPCNACEICRGILEESLMDVIEMDAASHNSVDDIRELKDHVNYPPARARYKVYIIDEVHMLSKGAFNALLKTLEEPPAHAIFMLATTEPEKIPDTIRSRCQIYSLKRVGPLDIKRRLQTICDGMGVEAEEKALYTLIEKTEGSVRDAIGLLDMVLTGSAERLTEEQVVEVLGLAPTRYYYEMTDALYRGKEAVLFTKVDELYTSGRNLQSFIEGWMGFLRNLLMTGLDERLDELVIASAEEHEKMRSFQREMSRAFLLRLMETLADLAQRLRYASHERILIEAAIMKLAMLPKGQELSALVERIDRLERRAPVPTVQEVQSAPAATIEPGGGPTTVEEENAPATDVTPEIPQESAAVSTVDPSLWGQLLDRVQSENNSVFTLIMEAEPISLEKGTLVIGFYDFARFQYNMMLAETNQRALIQLGRAVIGNLQQIKPIIIKEKPKKKDLESDVKNYFAGFEDKLSIED